MAALDVKGVMMFLAPGLTPGPSGGDGATMVWNDQRPTRLKQSWQHTTALFCVKPSRGLTCELAVLPPLASRLSLPNNASGGGILPPLAVRPAWLGDGGRDVRLEVIR